MSRRRSDPLRPLADMERTELLHLSRSQGAPAGQGAPPRALLAVADGPRHDVAAQLAGRHQGDTISRWISRFNREGLAGVVPHHGGGPRVRQRGHPRKPVLAEIPRTPDPGPRGTAT